MEYEAEWQVGSSLVEWHRQGRRYLNKAIKKYNGWLDRNSPREEAEKVLLKVFWCRVQLKRLDSEGTGEWFDTLDRIEANVRDRPKCPCCGK